MDKRFKEINERLIDYSQGKFDTRIILSEKKDEIDAISNGINMLGEELNEALISKNYLDSIFHSVSDMVIIIDKKGKIEDVNKACMEQLFYSKNELKGTNISKICKGNPFINKSPRGTKKLSFNQHPVMYPRNGKSIPVSIRVSPFLNPDGRELTVICATDISPLITHENTIMRAIIDTQEKERQRMAIDLHDALMQQIAAIKFHIACNLASIKSKPLLNNLEKANQLLNTLLTDCRNICINIMPPNLKEFGLVKAVADYSLYFNKHATFQIYEENVKSLSLTEALTIDLYRVVQELISNSIRHGKATKVTIRFLSKRNIFKMIFEDNGKGFDIQNYRRGMGLGNIQARIKSQNGAFHIQSTPLKGARFSISVPLNETEWLTKNLPRPKRKK
jgi:PAS domain S-box-containing protein